MNSKIFANSLIIACVAVLAWWFLRPAAPTPGSASAAQAHASAPPPADTAAVAEAPPEPQQVSPAPADSSADTAAAASQAQAELSSVLQSAAKLIAAGDYLTLLQGRIPAATWDQMSDDQKAALTQQLQARAQDPQVQQNYQLMITAMQGTTPTLDETGTVATYTLPPGNPRTTVVMTKINGRWVDLLSR
jgi:hypothetical protein